MKYLVVTMRRPEFDPDVVPAHYRFLDDLRDRSLLVEAGPFTDKSGGAYVLRAASLEEARSLAEQDPLALRQCSAVTVHEWDAR
jgi:uncharacterized protein YciI